MVLSIYSCVPKEEETYTNIDLTLDSKVVRKVIDFQDQLAYDSLYPYLRHVDPSLRYLAANAFSSQFEKKSIDSLKILLKDSVIRNKATAAYALGQTYDKSITNDLVNTFISIDTSVSVNNDANKNILEAIGKTGDASLLKMIANVDYIPSDKNLILGQTYAIYRYALRGIYDDKATEKMINFALESQYEDKVRVVAASYLSRSKTIDISKYKARLLRKFTKEKNVFVKMNLATVLGRTKDNDVMRVFITELSSNNDFKVKINMMRMLNNFPYINVIEPILLRLTDKNVFVAQAAADMLFKYGNKYDASIYQNYISERNHFALNAKIYAAVLNNLSSKSRNYKKLTKKLIKAIDNAKSEAEKLAYINALKVVPSQYIYVINQFETAKPSLKTALAETLVGMNKKTIDARFSGGNNLRKKILDIFKKEMIKGDVGVISIASLFFSDKKNGIKSLIGDDIEWMNDVLSKLQLPKEIESYNDLGKAIAQLNGSDFESKKVPYQHPIDWSILYSINDSTRCLIKTSQGDIIVELYPMESPGSVSNFLNLVDDNYYTDKVFHRVVSNFVIQTGCSRGDGYGSMDYSIRSELSGHYYDEEGYLGMASAGKNTESSQWFITLVPTPHLDGKYSIFGKVTKGMDVVYKINQGDTIISITKTSI